MFKLFKSVDPESLLKMAKAMGIDIYQIAEQKIPELLNLALELEHQAGGRLTATLSISEDSSHFILCLYKQQPGNNLELWQAYPLQDVKSIIDKIKTAITAHADASPEPAAALLTVSNGDAGSEPDPHDLGASAAAATDRERAAAASAATDAAAAAGLEQ